MREVLELRTNKEALNKNISPKWEPIITKKDERNIERDLKVILADYREMFPNVMNEEEKKEDYELYLSAMRMMLLHAKKINKQRHTPHKYRVNNDG